MEYEIWQDPGSCGRKYYVFYGLKDSAQMAEAMHLIAQECKVSVKNIAFHEASVFRGKELYIGRKPGARKCFVLTRKG